MVNFIALAVLIAIVGFAARYVHNEKKRGVKCIGCPDGCCSCSSENGASGCGCGCSCGTAEGK